MWSQIIDRQSIAVDCTAGNGHDAAFLASLGPQRLYCFDIQDEAIHATREKLQTFDCSATIEKRCHSHFPDAIQKETVTLFVYNLGYLPGKDKTITTRAATTMESLLKACSLLKRGGLISITCYPGHLEGAEEERTIYEWGHSLDPADWCLTIHQFRNRKQSPSVLMLQKNALQ